MSPKKFLTGTSKPVYYRVLLNENAVWKPCSGTSPLTKDILQLITYHMTFQYGTATKAVRSVPVVYYSSRLANMGMGYINYLRGRRGGDKQWIVPVSLDEGDENNKQKLRDGTVFTGVKYIRADVSETG